jgi:hypothetical protein
VGIDISPRTNSPLFSYIALPPAEDIQLHAEVRSADGVASNAPVTWQSTAPELAMVDSTGLVQTTPTYAACDVYQALGPIGCWLWIKATAGTITDSVSVLVFPRIVLEGTPELTLTVGDSAVVEFPVGKVDGQIRCAFFRAFAAPTHVIQASGGSILGVGVGEGVVGFMPTNNLCRGMQYSTLVHVVPPAG